MRLSLTPHPDTPCPALRSVEVGVERLRGGTLQLTYQAAGDLAQLALPAPVQPERADELWRHTCFEAFVRPEPGDGYVELNFAPSGAWAAYRFDGYRRGMAEADFGELRTMRTSMFGTLEYRVVIGLGPTVPVGAPWRLALSAVIEDQDGRIAYWALAHPDGKPDFHRAEGFTLKLPPIPF